MYFLELINSLPSKSRYHSIHIQKKFRLFVCHGKCIKMNNSWAELNFSLDRCIHFGWWLSFHFTEPDYLTRLCLCAFHIINFFVPFISSTHFDRDSCTWTSLWPMLCSYLCFSFALDSARPIYTQITYQFCDCISWSIWTWYFILLNLCGYLGQTLKFTFDYIELIKIHKSTTLGKNLCGMEI